MVVLNKSADLGFGQLERTLVVDVLLVDCKVLPESKGLDDQVVEVFGDTWSNIVFLEDSCDLPACEKFHIRNSVAIPQDHSDF